MLLVREIARAVLIPAVLVIMALSPLSAAASCVQTGPREQAEAADVVAYGTVTETRQTFAPASGVIRFRPERILKGTLPGEIEVYLGPTRGGPITSVDYEAVTRGQAHTLYLRSAGDGSWQTDACSGSHPGQPFITELTYLGSGTVVPPPSPVDNNAMMIGLIAVVGVALIAFLVVIRRYGGPSNVYDDLALTRAYENDFGRVIGRICPRGVSLARE